MSNKFCIIPAYNEEKNIGDVIKEVNKLGIKPIIIDDGSTDNTFNICKNNGAIAIRHETNKGKGEAIKTGIDYLLRNHPDFTHLVVIDADMQYHPEESLAIFKSLENNNSDIAIGYRDWRKVPFRHRLGNFVWQKTFNILFNTKLKDTNCGLIGFSRNAVEKIKDHILGGYIVDNSILIGAIKNNLKIDQVPVRVNYHKKSEIIRGIRIVLGILLYILREGLKYRLNRKK
ncbi:MAG: glycosyltransferase family 2 protein [Candidatus Aenigmatarchaeota archaeon]|nr:glycosyltransferase family 2 protein [Candidatus Aenigmarchaeota archaeon]